MATLDLRPLSACPAISTLGGISGENYMNAKLAACTALLVLCACNAPPPPLSAADVQQFVGDYMAANNAGDPTKAMSMVLHDASASSIAAGTIERGWTGI